MSQSLSLELSDEAYAALRRQAQAGGTSPAELAVAALERQLKVSGSPQTETNRQAARERFERHFGEINLGYTTGVDNIETVFVDESTHRYALSLLMARPDKSYSLCDAVSFS